MGRSPISSLARLAAGWASPAMDRPVYWRTLLGLDNIAVLIITRGKIGDPPPPPMHVPAARISPAFVRRTGGTLTPEQLLHERIGQHLRAHSPRTTQADLSSAASIATTAAVEALAELGVDISALTRPDDTAEQSAAHEARIVQALTAAWPALADDPVYVDQLAAVAYRAIEEATL